MIIVSILVCIYHAFVIIGLYVLNLKLGNKHLTLKAWLVGLYVNATDHFKHHGSGHVMSVFVGLQDSNQNVNLKALSPVTAPSVSTLSTSSLLLSWLANNYYIFRLIKELRLECMNITLHCSLAIHVWILEDPRKTVNLP